jgi:hypothetical protein
MHITVVVPDESDPRAQRTVQQVEAADQALRQNFAGFDLDLVVPEVERSWNEIGLDVPASAVRGYAKAIAGREDYELTLP